MTVNEELWLDSLDRVADECGVSYSDIDPDNLETGWDELRKGRDWPDELVFHLQKCYDKGFSPIDTQRYLIQQKIWQNPYSI